MTIITSNSNHKDLNNYGRQIESPHAAHSFACQWSIWSVGRTLCMHIAYYTEVFNSWVSQSALYWLFRGQFSCKGAFLQPQKVITHTHTDGVEKVERKSEIMGGGGGGGNNLRVRPNKILKAWLIFCGYSPSQYECESKVNISLEK